MSAGLEVRATADRGRGLFATVAFAKGERVVAMTGWLATTDALEDDWFVLQVGDDLWLCSHGMAADDCANHACEPNVGFLAGDTTLYALRDIAPGEEIGWDYSTSLSHPEWSLTCRCGAATCRGEVLPWSRLSPELRERLRPIALAYLRERRGDITNR